MRYALLPALLLIPFAAARAQRCPDVDPSAGYLVAASSAAPQLDSAWLTAFARAAAYRWRVPSRRRNLYRGWERVRHRLLPPEPRWADDWQPRAKHVALVRVVLRPPVTPLRVELTRASGDKTFDRTVRSIFDHPMPDSPELPALPPGVADSVVVDLGLGQPPPGEGRHGEIRFAAAQTRIALDRGSLVVYPPPGHSGPFPRTTVKYDVLPSGRVDPASFEFVRSAGPRFDDVIRAALLRARFTAPTSNCRAIAQTVVQTFGG